MDKVRSRSTVPEPVGEREIVDRLDAIVWLADAATLRVLEVTGRAASLLGDDRTAWTAEPTYLVDRLHPDDRAHFLSLCQRAIGERRDRQCEHRMTARDGTVVWLRTQLLPLDDGRLCGVSIDISEQALSSEVLRRAHDFTSALVDTVGALVVVFDKRGRIVRFNHACERASGYLARDVKGKRGTFLVPEVDRPSVRDAFTAIMAGQFPSTLVNRWRTADGRERRISWNNTALVDDKKQIEFVVATGIDITERTIAEDALRSALERERAARAIAEEERRRAAFLAEASTVLGSSLDYHTTITTVARLAVPYLADWTVVDMVQEDGTIRRVAVLTGDPAKAHLAARLKELGPSPAVRQGSSMVIHTGKAVVLNDVPVETMERARVGAGNTEGLERERLEIVYQLGVKAYLVVPLVARGRTLGALTFTSSSRARYEPEDIALAENIALRAAIAVDNALLYERAQRAIQLRDEFLSIASHELRTPVTSLLLAVQGLGRQVRKAPLSEVPAEFFTSAVETAERQSRQLARLVDALLDMSRIEAGHFELHVMPVDLCAVVREVAASMRQEIERQGCTLTVDGPAELVGEWDPTRVEQVVTNLMSNAVKYGAGTPIHVSLTADAERARLVVADAGIGIAPELHPHIFERFGRAAPARNYGGIGLGLYIVRRIVEAHGGSVRLESAPGQGAVFTVELPRRREAVALPTTQDQV